MSTAQTLILRAQTALQDPAGVRWSATELVGHLNDAQRELTRLRPDTKAAIAPMELAAGFYQQLPDTYMVFMDLVANTAGRRRRITKVDMVQLDAVEPTWRSRTAGTEVVHFMHDLREPRAFHVYPPVQAATQVDLQAATYPVDVPAPTAPGLAFTTVTGDIDFGAKWADALYNFVMFKAYSKDAEFGGNAQLAMAYLGLFNAAIGSQLQSSTAVAPQT